jgi:nucleotide-binding universal stress UspA family protein
VDTIVVGLDESKGARVAAQWAAKHAKQSGARVLAFHAVPRSGLWMLDAAQFDTDALLAHLRQELEHEWAAPLREAGVDYTTQLVRGDPATELLRVTKRVHGVMLVLGSKSHGAMADLVVGGTVHKVINRSDIPVVLVPNPPSAKRAASPSTKKAASPRKRAVRRVTG